MGACESAPTKVETDQAKGPTKWDSSMQNLKRDLIELQPFIFDQRQFEDAKNKEFLAEKIHNLSEEAKSIKHNPTLLSQDPTVRFVAAQFTEDLQRADQNFSGGWTGFSRTQLMAVTGFCVECHTRMNQGPEFNSANVRPPYLVQLPLKNQVEFKIAFREYDAAFALVIKTLYDSHSNDIRSELDQIARLGLSIAVQYKQDREKAKSLTSIIAKNKDLPLYLKKDSQQWQKSLLRWNKSEALKTLPDIRKFIKQRHKSEVDDMRAIAALLQYLTQDLKPNELGEALLLTGESYESLNKISFMALHENYYESCVRKVAQTIWGRKCYDKLENAVTLGYTGSGGTFVPPDVKDHLKLLKKSID